ncbi:hypothetical protein [Paenibacillus sp. sgz500958]|uniref:hypothetical protein n=1 Tax=Paenibacillus sp. sgz500958 TaxID=3242475 RepID=UPI0036D2A214
MCYLPPAKSKQWLFWFPFYALLLWLAFVLHRFVFLDNQADGLILLRLGLFALAVSAIVSGFGWLGARLVWLFSTIGIILGVVQMILTTYRDMSGWEDLAGFLMFMVFMIGGFAAGLVAEGINLLIKRQRRHS